MDLTSYLKNINVLKLKPKGSTLTYEQILKSEANRLVTLIQSNINDYYHSYAPRKYHRTGRLTNAFTVDDLCSVSAKGMTITVRVNNCAIHNSIIDGSPSNALWLMDRGWHVRDDVWFSDIYRFGYYEGAHFIESAVDEFKSTTKYNIKVKIIAPDNWW